MDRFQAICLWIVAGLILAAGMLPVSAETVPENETDVMDTAPEINYTEILDPGVELNFRFLTSMLQMLDLNLNLINETLNSRVSEYPFLQPTIEGTSSGIATVDSILLVLGSDPAGINGTNLTEGTEEPPGSSLERLNESLESPDAMLEAANSTLGEPDATTPMIIEMFESIKALISLFG